MFWIYVLGTTTLPLLGFSLGLQVGYGICTVQVLVIHIALILWNFITVTVGLYKGATK